MLGQLLMAYLSESEVDRLLQTHPLTPVTRKSITDPDVFKELGDPAKAKPVEA